MNDNEQRPVTIITGRVRRRKGGKSEGVHIMLVAPDDDTAVRTALESLTREGFAEAELAGAPHGATPGRSPAISALSFAVAVMAGSEPVNGSDPFSRFLAAIAPAGR